MHAQRSQHHQNDKTRQLQRKLYLSAKKNRNRRYHALYDRIYRPDVLWRAWEEVKENKGSSGIDGETLEDIEAKGAQRFIQELATILQEGRYRPQAVRRVHIPKSDGGQRRLGIPTVRDRVVQQACRIVIEPVFEANFQECSYGFRPKRSAHQAIIAIKESLVMKWHVIDADIQGYFDHIDHKILMEMVKRRISDRRVLKLIRQWLEIGVMEGGKYEAAEEGTPQGGVISPLLSNIYLHALDMLWKRDHAHLGELFRYADDFVITCRSEWQAREGMKAVKRILKRLKLEVHPEKTRVVDLNQKGFDFLGYHFQKFKSRVTKKISPYIWPSQKSMKRIRQKIHELTDVRWLKLSLEEIVKRLNFLIGGWRGYFGLGNGTRKLNQLDRYLRRRIWKNFWRRIGKRTKKILNRFIRWIDTCKIEKFYMSRKRGGDIRKPY